MMKIYALILNGKVGEIIEPAPLYDTEAEDWVEGELSRIGTERPIDVRFTPQFIEWLVDITDVLPRPEQDWTYDGSGFHPPAPHQPSPEEILSQNQLRQANLKALASQAMTPFVLSLTIGNATGAEKKAALAWQAYSRNLEQVDLSVTEPAWPETPA